MDSRLAAFKDAYQTRSTERSAAAFPPARRASTKPRAKETKPKPARESRPQDSLPRVNVVTTVLFKAAFGAEVRDRRTAASLTLRDLSRRSSIALGYLSEIERGQKEPSSEVIASVCAGLGTTVPEMLIAVAFRMMDTAMVSADDAAHARHTARSGTRNR